MIPIGDDLQRRIVPWMTMALIGANLLVFLYQMSMNPYEMHLFFHAYGFVPARITEAGVGNLIVSGRYAPLMGLLTSMFLHANPGHLIGNMWALWIFGDNVEEQLGPIHFVLFYLLSGLGAGLIHLVTNLHSSVPSIGASGALAGVMAAFMVLFPRARIITLVPVFFFFTLVHIPAILYLGIWFLAQLYFGAVALGANMAQGIAWWAHIGGFAVGLVLLVLIMGLRGGGLSPRGPRGRYD